MPQETQQQNFELLMRVLRGKLTLEPPYVTGHNFVQQTHALGHFG